MNRIILIGNGFDLAHDLKTRYADFINWYWEQRVKGLSTNMNQNDNDYLCNIHINSINGKFSSFVSLFEETDSIKGLKDLQQHPQIKVQLSSFFKYINQCLETKHWVDIEQVYYKFLRNSLQKTPYDIRKLNEELDCLKTKLIEYLTAIQQEQTSKSVVIPALKEQILAPIRPCEIAISNKSSLDDFVDSRLDYSEYNWMDLWKRWEKKWSSTYITSTWKDDIITEGIDSVINRCVPSSVLLPDRLLMLNFNYTQIADSYLPDEQEFDVNHIHGNLLSPESVIFGYGDELESSYKEIVNKNDNEYLRNIKSVHYLESGNYRKMLSFIESAPFQIYIMGHSCGNSDRTLLNTLFEHKNCVSIKPFYHKKSDGSNNYLEIVQNISRNFTDMKLMRDRVVNKTYCEALPQNTNKLI